MIIRYYSSGNRFMDALYPFFLIFIALVLFAFAAEIVDGSSVENPIAVIAIYVVVVAGGGLAAGFIWYKVAEILNAFWRRLKR